MKFEKSCGIIVFNKIGNFFEYLLVKSELNNHWGFPKGHIEIGESEIETAKRELYEETNLEVDLISDFRVSINYIMYKNIKKEVVFFLGKTTNRDVNIQLNEIKDFKWVDFSNANSLLSYKENKRVLLKANNYLKKYK